MAQRAEDWFAVSGHAAVETRGVIVVGRQRRRVEGPVLRELVLVMEAQDVEPVIPLRQAVPDPAGGWLSGGLSAEAWQARQSISSEIGSTMSLVAIGW